MQTALFHDYLNQFGGGERVLKVFADMFPSADIYTLLYDDDRTRGMFKGRHIKTSILDVGFIRRHHRIFIPLMPIATELMRVDEGYDLIISSSAGYAKGFGYGYRRGRNHNPYHICYCHSPLRYAWEIDYLKNLSFSPRPMSKDFLRPIARWLRNWDKNASGHVNLFIANSRFIAEKIRSYYGRDAEVLYPPVNTDKFRYIPHEKQEDYYLMVGRLLYYKGFDIGIEAFNRMKKPLLVIGGGPEEKKLKQLANPAYVRFVSGINDSELVGHYNKAKAFIFPQIEDFGLVAAEAQSCGLPVLAFNKGGGPEIVMNGKTGLLFSEQSPEAIMDSVREFEFKKFNRKSISEHAKRFSEKSFKENFLKLVRGAGFSV